MDSSRYPDDWEKLAGQVKTEAGWHCVRCGAAHAPQEGYCLTVHHLDRNPQNNRWWNLVALCQRCHLSIQGRVKLSRPYMLDHTPWFKVYVAGYYAFALLNEELTREETELRLEEILTYAQPWLYPEEAQDVN